MLESILRIVKTRIIVKLSTKTGVQERAATGRDIRDALLQLGYDVTTQEAESWGVRYPEQARNCTRICELRRELSDLENAVDFCLPPERPGRGRMHTIKTPSP